MKSVFAGLSLALGLLAFGAPSQAATIVTNGSFEDLTNFVDNGQDTDSVSGTTMNGWTVVNGPVAWIGPTNPFSLSASDGNYFLDLTDYSPGPGRGVEQAITTVANGLYQLEFDLGSDVTYGTPSGILASAGAASVNATHSATGGNEWTHFVLAFASTGTSTLISLIGSAGVSYIGLDNISVSFVGVANTPIPPSLLLFASALGGLGFIGWRRRQTAA
jgi:hypothetical protein